MSRNILKRRAYGHLPGRSPRGGRGSATRRLSFEPLEPRQLLATLTVNSLLDNSLSGDGLVTLREAIAAANEDALTDLGQTGSGADVIQFAGGLVGRIDLSLVGDTSSGPSAFLITSAVAIEGSAGVSTIGRAELGDMRLFHVASNGDLTLRSLNVTEGVAQGAAGELGYGGAIFVSANGRLTIASSTFFGNTAQGGSGANGRGGAIYNDGGTVTIRNSTVSGNAVRNSAGVDSGFGAGIYSLNGTLSIYNSTFAESAEVPGRSVYVFADGEGATSHLHVYNSIIGGPGNSSDLVAAPGDFGGDVVTSGAYNIVRTGPAVLIGGISTDPQIGPLSDNGGPTKTHAILPGIDNHPAVDTGDPNFDSNDPDGDPLTSDAIPNDQRGAPYARVHNGDGALGATVDIGAYEFQAAATEPELIGDYNGDHTVNAADYTVWRNTLGMNVPRWSGADGDGSQWIDTGDYVLWKQQYGQPQGAGAGSMADSLTSAPSSSTVSGPLSATTVERPPSGTATVFAAGDELLPRTTEIDARVGAFLLNNATATRPGKPGLPFRERVVSHRPPTALLLQRLNQPGHFDLHDRPTGGASAGEWPTDIRGHHATLAAWHDEPLTASELNVLWDDLANGR